MNKEKMRKEKMRKVIHTLIVVGTTVLLFFHFVIIATSNSQELNKEWSVSDSYHALILLFKYIYAYHHVQTPTVVNKVWWGIMACEDGGFLDVLDTGWDAYQICVCTKEAPSTTCWTAVSNTVKMIIVNVVKVAFGWNVRAIVDGLLIILGRKSERREKEES